MGEFCLVRVSLRVAVETAQSNVCLPCCARGSESRVTLRAIELVQKVLSARGRFSFVLFDGGTWNINIVTVVATFQKV